MRYLIYLTLMASTSLNAGSIHKWTDADGNVDMLVLSGTVDVTVTASSGRSVRTHALLDPGGDRTFCSVELLEALQIRGKKTKFTVSTLSSERDLNTQVVSLNVSPVDSSGVKSLDLDEVHGVDKLPSMKGSFAEPCDIEKYDHLV